jgi:hypothetical protein
MATYKVELNGHTITVVVDKGMFDEGLVVESTVGDLSFETLEIGPAAVEALRAYFVEGRDRG